MADLIVPRLEDIKILRFGWDMLDERQKKTVRKSLAILLVDAVMYGKYDLPQDVHQSITEFLNDTKE